MSFRFTKGRIIAISIVAVILVGAIATLFYAKSHKETFVAQTFSVFEKVSQLLPIASDTKKEIEAIDTLVSGMTRTDGVTRSYLILLQNNYELRPGGGFLGQYAVLKIKDGKLISSFVEDANLLDQRITVKVTPPYPLTRYMQLRKWKFRDSNFSPDFPTNVAKAQYFARLGGQSGSYDGVFAVNADVLDHILTLTGPITIPGYGTYDGEGAAMKLEEQVEKAYLGDDVAAEAKQARKNVMKTLANEILKRIATVDNIPKVSSLVLEELRDKNVQLWFKDATLEAAVASVHWDGSVTKGWTKDYLMVVDANMGALKTDFYVKRSLDYVVDFTGDTPKATVTYTYQHTATHGDWRTSDYHTYTRIYAPIGSKYIDQTRLHTGGISSQDSTDFQKTVFGYKVDCLIGATLPTAISYALPSSITLENYELLIQKQSGVGTIPVTITMKTKNGDFTQKADLKKDLHIAFQTTEQEKK
jgi:hypothetical protein